MHVTLRDSVCLKIECLKLSVVEGVGRITDLLTKVADAATVAGVDVTELVMQVAALVLLRPTPGGRVAEPWCVRSSSRSSSLWISLMLSAEPNLFLMR